MSRSSSDAGVQDAFTSAGLTRRQRSLLQTVLRALDSGSGLGFHASTSNSALVALIRAHDALRNHAEHAQPQRSLLLRVLRTSSTCARAGLPSFPVGTGRAELQAALDELAATTAALANADPAQQRALAGASAIVVEPLVTSLAETAADRLQSLWDAPVRATSRDASAATETAVSVYVSGRDREVLRRELIHLLTTRQPTAAEISALLWPQRRRHHVTVLVSGARSLDNLDDLLPGARQWPIAVHQDNNWPKSVELRALLEKLAPITRTGVLVRIPVNTTDPGTAVVLGRRAISEALDQYVAGNRIVDLALAGPWAVAGPDGRWVLGERFRASLKNTSPLLSSSWSEGVRPALRIAHVAQQVEAPMTSAALCWSAIESIGLDAEKAARLARACALQTLRHQIIDAHAQLRLTVTEEVRRLGAEAKKARSALRRAENVLARRSPLEQTTPADLAALTEAVDCAKQTRQACDAAHEHAVNETNALMEAVDAHVPRTAGKPILTEPDRWLDLLLPARTAESADLDAARRAVTALSTFAGGLTEETILLWRERLARPTMLATWLQEKQDTFHSLLEWLYTTRNIAFHNGRFAGPIDVGTAHAGRAVVDVLLELLSLWHSVQHARGQNPTPPPEILKVLAQRKDTLSSRLRTTSSCHRLSIHHLNGPDEVYWSATR
ncbi:hypothetical protein ACWEF6_06915 [Amycolatopsis sp. NPDC004772]